jgi:uncharacterized protein
LLQQEQFMAKNYADMENSNISGNPSIHEVSQPERRLFLATGAALGWSALAPACANTAGGKPLAAQPLGFKSIAIDAADRVVVPEGYTATAIAAWGEPIGVAGNMPTFKMDGSNSAADQAVQMGMHHDGLHFYSLDGSRRGLLAMNHEYVDDGLLHSTGLSDWTAEKVRKSQAAHGISVIEVEEKNGKWDMVRPSRYARRITANTPFAVQGPCRGHALMKTAADPLGHTVLGTLNNCASGKTPWGTYLSGEENFAFYFGNADASDPHQRRWGLRKDSFFGWPVFDPRFDISKTPHEPNRFGWVVEVDPMDPNSTPIKRTALGRAAHEGAWVAVTKEGRAVVYSGEDARNEYIYKFVSRDAIKPAGNGLTQAQANRELLDHGTLYVAKFNADGKGSWLPLVHGQNGLNAANGFADQGEVCIKARQASDLLGGTKMDRPEWLAIDERTGWVYCTLTNNSSRGAQGQPPVDAANPRANNVFGHIIRWKENGDFDNANFEWNHLLLAGDPAQPRAEAKGNVKGDLFAAPDGIIIDPIGRLWIQTDAHASQMHKGELVNIGNNQMLAYDPTTGSTRRFLTAPYNSEVTGATWTPDGKTVFINIQHPGETPGDRSDPQDPRKFSNWPDFASNGRPRSSTVVVRKNDGGVIGS